MYSKRVVREEPDHELDELVREVIDAAKEVHRKLGPGFQESIYEKSLALELRARGIPFRRQVPFVVEYQDTPVGEGRIDFLVQDRLVVELKASDGLAPIHLAQTISYLRATRTTLGLLINFNESHLLKGVRRVIYGVENET